MSEEFSIDNSEVAEEIRTILGTKEYGEVDRALMNNISGINTLPNRGMPITRNNDSQGYIFFGRPMCNMSYNNLQSDRRTSILVNSNERSYPYMVRCLLDPLGNMHNDKSPLYDPKNPFMPVLSNLCMTASGFPDFVVDTYTSEPGLHKEVTSQVDSTTDIYNDWDLNVTFQNTLGDPITLLFMAWVLYAASVKLGTMTPYFKHILELRMDYQIPIYRLVTSTDGHVINKMYKTRAFPYAVPTGASGNYNRESWLQTDSDIISIPFKCDGLDFFDPIIAMEFNDLMTRANPAMIDKSGYTKITPEQRPIFNHKSYPWINWGDETNGMLVLDWYVETGLYNQYFG